MRALAGSSKRTAVGYAVAGTLAFQSLNAHYRRSRTFADDLEAVGYCMIYFLTGEPNQFWTTLDPRSMAIGSAIESMPVLRNDEKAMAILQ